jgi:hypothetical protein
MSYSSQAELSRDPDFLSRVSACAAVEVPKPNSPTDWAYANIWWLAAAPGFADSYEYALNTGVERPGNDPAVITDAQILGAVQALIAGEATPPE